MELILNLAWALSAVAILCIWLRCARPAGASRGTQVVALAVLILILFPVISVTDDLQAAQNPAEADCLVRRNHGCATLHTMLPPIAVPALPVVAGPNFGGLRLTILGSLEAAAFDHPALNPIQNRPPPNA